MISETVKGSAQYLSFNLGEETFALDIIKVREVLEFADITKVPCMPPYMRGVINLRGTVVPVLDLRMKLGMSITEKSINTCVIITEISDDQRSLVIGALADSVHEVVELDKEEIAPSPRIGGQISADFLCGMGKRNNELVQILDINGVFSAADVANKMASSSPGLNHRTWVE